MKYLPISVMIRFAKIHGSGSDRPLKYFFLFYFNFVLFYFDFNFNFPLF